MSRIDKLKKNMWEVTYYIAGNGSHVHIVGKVILFPFVIFTLGIGYLCCLMDFFFKAGRGK